MKAVCVPAEEREHVDDTSVRLDQLHPQRKPDEELRRHKWPPQPSIFCCYLALISAAGVDHFWPAVSYAAL